MRVGRGKKTVEVWSWHTRKNGEDVVVDAEGAEERDELFWLFMLMVLWFCLFVLERHLVDGEGSPRKYESKEAFRIYG
jgi:hypothetical protein